MKFPARGHSLRAGLVCAALALAACNNATGYDDTNSVNLNGTGAALPGSVDDPLPGSNIVVIDVFGQFQ